MQVSAKSDCNAPDVVTPNNCSECWFLFHCSNGGRAGGVPASSLPSDLGKSLNHPEPPFRHCETGISNSNH